MAQISRSTKVNGTTSIAASTRARAQDVETDMAALFSAWNNADSGTTAWTVVKAEGASSVPLVVNNSSGTQNIAQFQDNGTVVLRLADGGTLTLSPGGTTSVTMSSTGIALSNSGIISGLGEADANGEAVRYEALVDGWLAAGETWTYASASTFTVSGDVSAKYLIGDKIKLTQTTDKYFYVVKASHAAGTTTVTINGGTSYTLANATITSPYFSKLATPKSFPHWFTYSPTYSAGFGTTANDSTRYRLVGNNMEIRGVAQCGTVAASTGTIMLPSGYIIDTNLIVGSQRGWLGFLHDLTGAAGSAFSGDRVALLFYNGSNTDRMTFGYQQGSDTFVINNVNGLLGNNDYFAYWATIPVTAS